MSKKMLATMVIWWMVLFGAMTCTFQLGENIMFTTVRASGSTYNTFMTSFRQRVIRNGTMYTGAAPNRPILPTPTAVPSNNDRFVEVQLSNGNRTVTLIVDVPDLYVVAFKNPSKYFYLRDTPSQVANLFPGGEPLGFDGSYGGLEKSSGGKTRENSDIGVGDRDRGVFSAIDSLSATVKNTANQRKMAAGLIVVIQFVSEAARFLQIEANIRQRISSFIPTAYYIALENNWGSLCKLAQGLSPNGTVVQIERERVSTPEQALRLLGVMKDMKKA